MALLVVILDMTVEEVKDFFVGGSIVRKTDSRSSKGEDVVVCLPGARTDGKDRAGHGHWQVRIHTSLRRDEQRG